MLERLLLPTWRLANEWVPVFHHWQCLLVCSCNTLLYLNCPLVLSRAKTHLLVHFYGLIQLALDYLPHRTVPLKNVTIKMLFFNSLVQRTVQISYYFKRLLEQNKSVFILIFHFGRLSLNFSWRNRFLFVFTVSDY